MLDLFTVTGRSDQCDRSSEGMTAERNALAFQQSRGYDEVICHGLEVGHK